MLFSRKQAGIQSFIMKKKQQDGPYWLRLAVFSSC